MSKKRTNKKQQESREKEALRRRVKDIFIGCNLGELGEWDQEPMVEPFIQFVRALKETFCVKAPEGSRSGGNEHLWNLWNLHNFKTPDSATDFLFRNDVRA